MDRLSRQRRSWNMSQIRSKDTAPELVVRSVLSRMRYRMELNASDLPGSPDIVLQRRKIAIFVHGCFWHRHAGCKYAYTPKTRIDFWLEKFRANTARDRKVHRQIVRLGWQALVIWECETEFPRELARRLREYFAHAERISASTVTRKHQTPTACRTL